MRALILVNAFGSTETRQVKRLNEELVSRGVHVTVKRNNGFETGIKNGNVAVDTDCDFCVYLDKDKYVSRLLEKRGVRLFNKAAAIEACDDKMTTHIELADAGIPMPHTLPGLLCYDADAPLDMSALDKVSRKLGYPLIVKQSYGSMGGGVFKVDTREEFSETAERVKLTPHLFQEYIGPSHGVDMRVIVIGGKTIGGIIRRSDGDFRSNIGLGGHAEKTDVPDDIKAYAERAAKILDLDYCGIDFLLGTTPLLCEVNSNAFFDAFEQATGINVAAIYAEHMLGATDKIRSSGLE